MLQKAIVKSILPSGIAQVSLMRQLECGLSCNSCDGCPQRPAKELLALADNAAGVLVGQTVTVRPKAGGAVPLSLLVFLLPCIFLGLGYLLCARVGLSEGLCLVGAFVGLLLGFCPAVLLDKTLSHRGVAEFTIVTDEV